MNVPGGIRMTLSMALTMSMQERIPVLSRVQRDQSTHPRPMNADDELPLSLVASVLNKRHVVTERCDQRCPV